MMWDLIQFYYTNDVTTVVWQLIKSKYHHTAIITDRVYVLRSARLGT